ncbi:RluA family pseudouridine synthase [Lichenihabitans psoromatis]|uniref:RluA family pseudouridine synthase n=1 Tax=Lichenihabitans psoromatis TaxID=2528642 RepID=UPI001035D9E1|nr:RluA family pseudouridine synthase [Lichenihabitans psoromatis]
MSVETLIVASDEDGMRLDRWFKLRVPGVTVAHLNKVVRTGQVRVDGGRAKTSTRLVEGQKVRIPPLGITAESLAAPSLRRTKGSEQDRRDVEAMILFEDRGLMVLNKPFGLAVQGGSGTYHHLDGMLDAFTDQNGDRPRLVHRLDRDTSGVLLVAKTRKMAADLGAVFKSRNAQKIYWALLEGVPKPAQGRISLFLAKGELMGDARSQKPGRPVDRAPQERMRVAKHGEEDAQHSVTYYTVVDKVLPRVAWVSMKPITGRTHQLRAHAEAIGHPIVGDPKYNGGSGPNPRRTDPLRSVPTDVEQKLHLLARRLVLPNPSGGSIDVTAPLPPHMQATWDLFGFDVKQYDPIDDAPE